MGRGNELREEKRSVSVSFALICEIAIRDQFNAFARQQFSCGSQRQNPQLDLAGFTEPRMRCLQLGIVVPRMTNKLPRPLRNTARYRLKQLFIQRPGDLDPQRPIGCGKSIAFYRLMEAPGKTSQDSYL